METTNLDLSDKDQSELYYAFMNRGSSNLKRKVAKWLRDYDKRNGISRPNEWYNQGEMQ